MCALINRNGPPRRRNIRPHGDSRSHHGRPRPRPAATAAIFQPRDGKTDRAHGRATINCRDRRRLNTITETNGRGRTDCIGRTDGRTTTGPEMGYYRIGRRRPRW